MMRLRSGDVHRMVRDEGASGAFIALVALIVASMVSMAVLGYAVIVADKGTPEWVLNEYMDAINAGDVEAAARLTIASLMDEYALSAESSSIEEELEGLGVYRYWMTNLTTHAGDSTDISKHTLWLAGEAIFELEAGYGVEFDHSYDEMAFIDVDIHLSSSEEGDVQWHVWVIFLESGSRWHMVP